MMDESERDYLVNKCKEIYKILEIERKDDDTNLLMTELSVFMNKEVMDRKNMDDPSRLLAIIFHMLYITRKHNNGIESTFPTSQEEKNKFFTSLLNHTSNLVFEIFNNSFPNITKDEDIKLRYIFGESILAFVMAGYCTDEGDILDKADFHKKNIIDRTCKLKDIIIKDEKNA